MKIEYPIYTVSSFIDVPRGFSWHIHSDGLYYFATVETEQYYVFYRPFSSLARCRHYIAQKKRSWSKVLKHRKPLKELLGDEVPF